MTATTGAGKTVMAAAVFEALFYGDDDFDFEPDSGAVVIWFSDDPSLNEQSNYRLMEAADRLNVSQLRTVGNDFSREKFDGGKVYFLNTQKLSKNSMLVRGGGEPQDDQQPLPMPDARSHTIWDTIRNTIEDPDLTLYLVLDEARRGMRDGAATRSSGTPTIVKQLINGRNGLARYAEMHGEKFRRIDAVAVLNGQYRVLDMKEKVVREVVLGAADAGSIYQSGAAREYVIHV